MFGRDHAARGSRVRSRVIALTLATGLVVPGALLALTPSTAGADTSDPLGPTVTQLEASIDTAVANVQPTSTTLELLIGQLGEQPSCIEYVVDGLLGQPEAGSPPFYCLV